MHTDVSKLGDEGAGEPSADRRALRELVNLEDMRLKLKQLHEIGHGTDYTYYHERLPLAWEAARAALSNKGAGEKANPTEPTERIIGYTTEHDLDFPFAYAHLGPQTNDRCVPVYVRAALSGEQASPTHAARDVLAERRRQVAAEGWTPEHDDEHSEGELALAAAAYACVGTTDASPTEAPAWWPWDAEWWKPAGNRRNLVKAGALILAEIERLDRAQASPNTGEQG